MTKLLFPLSLTVAIFATLVALRPTDVLTDTGVTMTDIRSKALQSLRYEGSFYLTTNALMRNAARRIPVASQAATVRMLGKVVRTYVESDAFRQAYRQSLSDRFPVDETYSDANLARREAEVNGAGDVVAAQTNALQQAYAGLDPAMVYTAVKMQLPQQEAELANQTGDERRSMQQAIAETKRLLTTYAGKPAEFKKQYLALQQQQLRQNARQQAGEATDELAEARKGNADYRKQKAALDANSNFRPLLRKQLQAFIILCDDVDFSARLMPSGSRQEFVNPAYRVKSSNWKLLYRLGKEPVMAARAVAQEWQADLN